MKREKKKGLWYYIKLWISIKLWEAQFLKDLEETFKPPK